ncbi:MAG: helix-turn-helix domain-containing protein [Gaiellales bacterium]
MSLGEIVHFADAGVEPKEQVGALVELGLTLNQARIYLSLLEHGAATAAETATRSGVPRPKVYGALEALERRGFCVLRGDRVALWEPIPPELALSEWIRARQHERRSVAEREERLRNSLVTQLPRVRSQAIPRASLMEAAIGRARVAELFEQLVASAERNIDVVHTSLTVQPRERWNLLELEALQRGVEIRALCTSEAADDPQRFEALLAGGAEVRQSDGMILKLAIRDGAEALVALHDPEAESQFAAVRIVVPDLIAPLQLQFQRAWRLAEELRPVARKETL